MTNLKIAFRFMFKKPIQYLFILIVVTIGVSVFYFVYNASDGLKRVVLNATAETGSYVSVKGDFDFSSYNDPSVKSFRDEAFKNDNRIQNISCTLSAPANLNRIWLQSNQAVSIKGIDFLEGGNIQKIRARTLSERVNRLPNTLEDDPNFFGEIVIGNRLSSNLGFEKPKDAINKPLKVDILVDKNTIETFVFKIVAVHFTDNIELSEKIAFTTIETLHKIDAFKNKANQIEISTSNPLNSDDVSYKLDSVLNNYYSDYTLTNWQEGNKYIVNALYIEDVSIYLIQIVTAVAIAFGLASIITFIVRERNQQIGILKTLGLKNSDVIIIFLIQIFLIITAGLFLGLNLGNYIVLTFMKVFKRPNSDIPLITLKLGIRNSYSLLTIIVMSLSSLIASFIPLRMAKKYRLIDIIKGD